MKEKLILKAAQEKPHKNLNSSPSFPGSPLLGDNDSNNDEERQSNVIDHAALERIACTAKHHAKVLGPFDCLSTNLPSQAACTCRDRVPFMWL